MMLTREFDNKSPSASANVTGAADSTTERLPSLRPPLHYVARDSIAGQNNGTDIPIANRQRHKNESIINRSDTCIIHSEKMKQGSVSSSSSSNDAHGGSVPKNVICDDMKGTTNKQHPMSETQNTVIEYLRNQLAVAQSQVKSYRSALRHLRSEVTALRSQLHNLQNNHHDLPKKNSDNGRQARDALLATNTALRAENYDLRRRLATMTAENDFLQTENEQLSSDADQVVLIVDNLREQLRRRKDEEQVERFQHQLNASNVQKERDDAVKLADRTLKEKRRLLVRVRELEKEQERDRREYMQKCDGAAQAMEDLRVHNKRMSWERSELREQVQSLLFQQSQTIMDFQQSQQTIMEEQQEEDMNASLSVLDIFGKGEDDNSVCLGGTATGGGRMVHSAGTRLEDNNDNNKAATANGGGKMARSLGNLFSRAA